MQNHYTLIKTKQNDAPVLCWVFSPIHNVCAIPRQLVGRRSLGGHKEAHNGLHERLGACEGGLLGSFPWTSEQYYHLVHVPGLPGK